MKPQAFAVLVFFIFMGFTWFLLNIAVPRSPVTPDALVHCTSDHLAYKIYPASTIEWDMIRLIRTPEFDSFCKK
jgi:hypothetical protein